MGRVLFEQDGAVFDWPGVTLVFRVEADSFGLELEDGRNDYNVYVDGELKEIWRTQSREAFRLFKGKADLVHEVRLVKRTEASWGEAVFRGLWLPPGARLHEPPMRPSRRILFWGDSLACGYGVEGRDPLCPGCRDLENVEKSYAGLLTRELQAESQVVAWSGKGLLRNYGDPAPRSEEPLPVYGERIVASRPETVWDPSGWRPRLIVVELGSNDFSTEPSPDPREWVQAYAALLRNFRRRFPEAALLCAADGTTGLLGTCVKEAVQRIKAEGLCDVSWHPWEKFNIREMGCDYHPDVRAQRRMFEQILPTAREVAGW